MEEHSQSIWKDCEIFGISISVAEGDESIVFVEKVEEGVKISHNDTYRKRLKTTFRISTIKMKIKRKNP